MVRINHSRVKRIRENLGIIVSSIINDFEDPSHVTAKETMEYIHNLHRKRGNGSEQVRRLGLSTCTLKELNAAVRSHENLGQYVSFMRLLHEESIRVQFKAESEKDPHLTKSSKNGNYPLSSLGSGVRRSSRYIRPSKYR